MKSFIPYGKQFIADEDIQAVIQALKSPLITQGPAIKKFEEALCLKLGCKYAVAVNSGTAALHVAYFAIGLNANDDFITTPNTFVATANAGLYLGANPVFTDIEFDTGNINSQLIEDSISSKTKAIIPVHYAGQCADMKEIQKIALKHDLKVIEDASHAIGARYDNSDIGSCAYSDITTLSFHPVKHITTAEGGAILTNNEEYYLRALQYRNHGITKDHLINASPGPWYYEMQHLGYNYRITDIQSVLGISQLSRLSSNISRRKEVAKSYNKKLKDNPWFDLPVEKKYSRNSWHLYPIRLKEKYISKKSSIFKQLFDEGIGVQTHYIPVYTQPYYRNNGFSNLNLTEAENFYSAEISIPMYHTLTELDQNRVIATLENIFHSL